MALTQNWKALREDMLRHLPQVVSAWRNVAQELKLNPARIAWIGPIETVAYRVLEEAKRQGWTPDQARAAAIKVAGLKSATIPVNAGSVDRTASAVRAMLKLGEAAREALYAQSDVMGERDMAAARAKIEAARSLLVEAEAEFDTLSEGVTEQDAEQTDRARAAGTVYDRTLRG